MRTETSFRILMAALGLATLGLTACDDARELLEGLKGSGHHGAGGVAGGPGIPEAMDAAPPASGSCAGETTAASCDDLAGFNKWASQTCEAKGMHLKSASLGDQSGPGVECLATYLCCDKVTMEPEDPFAGLPIAGPSHLAQFKCCASETDCDVVHLGSDATCQDTAAWQAEASKTCAAKMRTLYGLGLYSACTP